MLVSFLLLTISSFGQKSSITINYKPSLTSFGQQSQSFQHYYFASRKGDPTFNNTINVLYNHQLSSRVVLMTGLEYSQQGQNINFNADSAFPSSNRKILKVQLNYLRLPLTVGYSIYKTTNSNLNIYSGVSLGIAIKRRDNYQDIIIEDILLPPANKRYKNTDWAIPIGIQYKKELTPLIYINVGGEYLLGLTNSFTNSGSSKFGVLSEFKNSRQNRLAISFGVGINLTK